MSYLSRCPLYSVDQDTFTTTTAFSNYSNDARSSLPKPTQTWTDNSQLQQKPIDSNGFEAIAPMPGPWSTNNQLTAEPSVPIPSDCEATWYCPCCEDGGMTLHLGENHRLLKGHSDVVEFHSKGFEVSGWKENSGRHALSTANLRTGELQHNISPSFNPYDIYPNTKPTLGIAGDLSTMCKDWTREEKLAKRRLVEFSRTQTGSDITVSFKAVSLQERQPNNPCISCIHWESKAQYYVTSTDIIALLEAIIAVRFTVEEKSRIRRNLQQFNPDTVLKKKDEHYEFFRLIMDFPDPKPRNIEKNIKIFPWPILEQALKKIVSKFSASYASTKEVILGREPNNEYEK